MRLDLLRAERDFELTVVFRPEERELAIAWFRYLCEHRKPPETAGLSPAGVPVT